MKHSFINYLHFSRKERAGAFFLTLVCAAVFAFPEIARRFQQPKTSDFSAFESETRAFRDAAEKTETPAGALFNFDPNTASPDDLVRLGLSEKVAGIICRYRDKGGKFRSPEDFQKIWSLPKDDYERLLPYIQVKSAENESNIKISVQKPEHFAFDPNTATGEDLQRLGLPARTVKSILNYRNKGGRFKSKNDLRKIYTLDEEDFARLEPFIDIAAVASVSPELPRPVAYSGNGGQHFLSKPAIKGLVDINRASAEEWQQLPGIGEKRAAQIVKFRESLGGFVSVEQVGEMYGLPDSVFQRIKPMLAPNAGAVRKIDINAASAEALDAHPYISMKQAKLIVAHREQHGAYATVDDLADIAAFSDRKWLEKVKPYLLAR